VDNSELADLVGDHQIAGVPTLAIYKDSKKVYQQAGFVAEKGFIELEEKYLK
jgi:hypothetical protein